MMERFLTRVRWMMLLLVSLTFSLALGYVVFFKNVSGTTVWHFLGICSLLGGLIGCLVLLYNLKDTLSRERQKSFKIWTFLAWFGVVVPAWLPEIPRFFIPGFFACAFAVVLIHRPRYGVMYAISLLIVLGCGHIFAGVESEFGGLTVIFFIVAIAVWVIRFFYHEFCHNREELSQLRREVGQLTQTNVRLQNHVIQMKEIILTEERDRIAREFHDTLGHTLTALVVKMEAIQGLIGVNTERAITEVNRLCGMVREALRETRLVVAGLRDPDSKVLRGRALWVYLCETFAHCTGIVIKTDIEEEFAQVDDVINAVVYRFVQEALTNAYRHGEADLIDVAIWWRPDELRVRVSDNGHGLHTLEEGFGITGIRERIGELGGQVGWRSEKGKGFDIAVMIPWNRGGEGAKNSGNE